MRRKLGSISDYALSIEIVTTVTTGDFARILFR